MLSSLGGAYLMLWRARGEATSGNRGSSGVEGQAKGTQGSDIRLDVSSERTDLLHRAQHFLEEALLAPDNLNDPAIRAQVAFCREARGDCKEALVLYASIISDSALSPGTSAVIFRTSVLLAYVGRFDECVRYLEFIEGQRPKGCSLLLIQALLYTCYVSIGLEMKASRGMETLREALNVEYTAGRILAGFSRDEIPWDRLPGCFDMWRELGLHSLRNGDYYAGVQMFLQATLQREDAETMVCTGEMLWVLGDAKVALALCERAYAADPLHAGAKRRLSAWAPGKWKDRIAKEEERREAVTEMRRLADLSNRKADAMLARRRRREKTWRAAVAAVTARAEVTIPPAMLLLLCRRRRPARHGLVLPDPLVLAGNRPTVVVCPRSLLLFPRNNLRIAPTMTHRRRHLRPPRARSPYLRRLWPPTLAGRILLPASGPE
ncbi:unnamed protein product [Scytosiphon promiscuus]